MTATLTDRYIAATVRSLPAGLQTEVRDELRASIADAVDARTENGEPLEHAEHAVLTELGDPAALAAGYADRPLHLIGPKYYLTWWRLLKILLAVVPACSFGGVAIAQALAGAGIGEIIGEAIVVVLSVIVHVSFWTTLVFFVLERTGADAGAKWSLDQLPEDPHDGTGRADLIVSLVMLALFAGAVLWDQLRGWAPSAGEPLSILNPALWPWGIGALLALLVAEAALAIAVHARGHWTMTFAWINAALAAVVMVLGLTALVRGALYNPRFVDEVFAGNGVNDDALIVLAVLTGFAIVGITLGDMIDGWRKAARARLAR
ncbi:permease prefix domain 1-containing protein [Microbacterium sp. NPDC055521]